MRARSRSAVVTLLSCVGTSSRMKICPLPSRGHRFCCAAGPWDCKWSDNRMGCASSCGGDEAGMVGGAVVLVVVLELSGGLRFGNFGVLSRIELTLSCRKFCASRTCCSRSLDSPFFPGAPGPCSLVGRPGPRCCRLTPSSPSQTVVL